METDNTKLEELASQIETMKQTISFLEELADEDNWKEFKPGDKLCYGQSIVYFHKSINGKNPVLMKALNILSQ